MAPKVEQSHHVSLTPHSLLGRRRHLPGWPVTALGPITMGNSGRGCTRVSFPSVLPCALMTHLNELVFVQPLACPGSKASPITEL